MNLWLRLENQPVNQKQSGKVLSLVMRSADRRLLFSDGPFNVMQGCVIKSIRWEGNGSIFPKTGPNDHDWTWSPWNLSFHHILSNIENFFDNNRKHILTKISTEPYFLVTSENLFLNDIRHARMISFIDFMSSTWLVRPLSSSRRRQKDPHAPPSVLRRVSSPGIHHGRHRSHEWFSLLFSGLLPFSFLFAGKAPGH